MKNIFDYWNKLKEELSNKYIMLFATFNQEVQRLTSKNKFLIEENGLFRHPIFEFSTVDLSTRVRCCRIGTNKANFLA